MTTRSMISRREPVIALEPFRYRGRNYKEGSPLDRRRCRMPHSKLVRLIREGVCVLAKDVDSEKLAEYGFTYNSKNPRLKLNRISRDEVLKQKNDLVMKKLFDEDEDVVEDKDNGDDNSDEPTMKHSGGGWYDIMVSGRNVNIVGLRKDDALDFIASYKEGE